MTDRRHRINGIWAKLARTKQHLNELKAFVDTEVENHPIRLGVEPQQEMAAEYFVKVVYFKPPDFMTVGVRIGEIVHNLRSALDAMIWHLAIENTGSEPPPHHRRVAFPIFDNADRFTEQGVRAIESLAEKPRTIIEDLQPYHRRHAPKLEPLSLLSWLSNTDKHQVVAPMAVVPESFDQQGTITVSHATNMEKIRTGEPVENDANLYIIRFDQPTVVKMQFHGTFNVVLDLGALTNAPEEGYVRFDRVLGAMWNETREVVTRLESFF